MGILHAVDAMSLDLVFCRTSLVIVMRCESPHHLNMTCGSGVHGQSIKISSPGDYKDSDQSN